MRSILLQHILNEVLPVLIHAVSLLAEDAEAQLVLFAVIQRLLDEEALAFTAASFNEHHFLAAVGEALAVHHAEEAVVIPILTALLAVSRRVEGYFSAVEDASFFKPFASCYVVEKSSATVVDLMLQLIALMNVEDDRMVMMMLEGDVLFMAMSLLKVTKDVAIMERVLEFVDAMCKYQECCRYVVESQGMPILLQVFRFLQSVRGMSLILSVLMSITQFKALFEQYAVEEVVSIVQSTMAKYAKEPHLLFESMMILGNVAVLPLMIGVLCHLALCRTAYEFGGGLAGKLWADGQALRCGGVVAGGLAVGCEALLSKVVSIIVFVVLLLAALLGALHMTPQEAAERVRSYGESLRRDEDDDFDDLPEDFTPASAPVSEKKPAAKRKKRPSIDIPLDGENDGTVIPPATSFFPRRSEDVRTPDQVLRPPVTPPAPIGGEETAAAPEAPAPKKPLSDKQKKAQLQQEVETAAQEVSDARPYRGTIFNCPADTYETHASGGCSYGVNGFLQTPPGSGGNFDVSVIRRKKITAFRNPSATLLASDIGHFGGCVPHCLRGHMSALLNARERTLGGSFSLAISPDEAQLRHNGGSSLNVLYLL